MNNSKAIVLLESLIVPAVVTLYFVLEKLKYNQEEFSSFKTIYAFIFFWCLIVVAFSTAWMGYKKSKDKDFLSFLILKDVRKEETKSNNIQKIRKVFGFVLSFISSIVIISMFVTMLQGTPAKLGLFELALFSICLYFSLKPITHIMKAKFTD